MTTPPQPGNDALFDMRMALRFASTVQLSLTKMEAQLANIDEKLSRQNGRVAKSETEIELMKTRLAVQELKDAHRAGIVEGRTGLFLLQWKVVTAGLAVLVSTTAVVGGLMQILVGRLTP